MAEVVVTRVEASIRPDSAQRRAVDLLVAATLLVVLLPLVVLLAVLIRLDSPGWVFFRQVRVGRDTREFRMCKFRSMRRDAERIGPQVTGAADPRVTRLGRVLRVSKLDELPQLWNVLLGDMTLIGPRPEVPRYTAYYHPTERIVFRVRPGMTGPGQLYYSTDHLAALDGAADPEREYLEHQMHDKLAVELDYLRHRSLAADLSILGGTVKVVLAAAMLVASAGCARATAVEGAHWPPSMRYMTDSSDSTRRAVDMGFNLVDIPPLRGALRRVPPGARALVWLGQYDNASCTWELSNDRVRSLLKAEGDDPRVAGFYIADEPHVDVCPTAPLQLKARSALVHRLAPHAFTYAVIEDGDTHPGEYAAFRRTVDVVGLDPYPCTFVHGCRYGEIDSAVRRARAAGITRIWGVIQAFQDDYYRFPTAEELRTMLLHWRHAGIAGEQVFSWTYGGNRLTSRPDLVTVLRQSNRGA